MQAGKIMQNSAWTIGLVGPLALCAGLGAWVAPAAAEVIGVANTANCFPFTCNDSGTSSGQTIDYFQIYSSAVFAGPLSIGSLTFYDSQFPSTSLLNGNYSIFLGTTSDPLNQSYPVTVTNSTPFFTGSLGGNISNSFTITGTPFNYDPATGNLVLEVVASNQDNVPNGSGNGYLDADSSGTSTTRAYLITGQGGAQNSVGLVTGFDVSAVPLPPALPMFGAALLGLAGLGYARRRSGEKPCAEPSRDGVALA